MIDPNFSLTRDLVINNTRALLTDESNFLQRELLARVLAATTSVFAAMDFAIHAVNALYEGVCLGKGCESLDKVTFFAKATLIGSIAGIINPKALAHFDLVPNILERYGASNAVIDILNKDNPSEEDIQRAVELIEGYSLYEKDRCAAATKFAKYPVPKEILQALYMPSDEEITTFPWSAGLGIATHRSTYYHTTNKEGLLGILKTGRVNVEHQSTYRGAFVSANKIETSFGDVTIAFYDDIERISHLANGFFHEDTYWAGFSCPIPVNKDTVQAIIVRGFDYQVDLVRNYVKEHLPTGVRVLNYSNIGRKEPAPIPKEWKKRKVAIEIPTEDICFDMIVAGKAPQQTLFEDMLEPFQVVLSNVLDTVSAIFVCATNTTAVKEPLMARI